MDKESKLREAPACCVTISDVLAAGLKETYWCGRERLARHIREGDLWMKGGGKGSLKSRIQ